MRPRRTGPRLLAALGEPTVQIELYGWVGQRNASYLNAETDEPDRRGRTP